MISETWIFVKDLKKNEPRYFLCGDNGFNIFKAYIGQYFLRDAVRGDCLYSNGSGYENCNFDNGVHIKDLIYEIPKNRYDFLWLLWKK